MWKFSASLQYLYKGLKHNQLTRKNGENMKEKKTNIKPTDSFSREGHINMETFGHDIPEKIELEPFTHPSIALQNARLNEEVKKKLKK